MYTYIYICIQTYNKHNKQYLHQSITKHTHTQQTMQKRLLSHRKCVGVGECGLDFFKHTLDEAELQLGDIYIYSNNNTMNY